MMVYCVCDLFVLFSTDLNQWATLSLYICTFMTTISKAT